MPQEKPMSPSSQCRRQRNNRTASTSKISKSSANAWLGSTSRIWTFLSQWHIGTSVFGIGASGPVLTCSRSKNRFTRSCSQTSSFHWQDYCRANGLDPATSPPSREYRKWRNCKCDVQAIWSHIHGKRDVFVTSDGTLERV